MTASQYANSLADAGYSFHGNEETFSIHTVTCSWVEWLGMHASHEWTAPIHRVQLSDEPKLLSYPQGDATVYGFFNGGESDLLYDKAYYELDDVIDGLLKYQWPGVEFERMGR